MKTASNYIFAIIISNLLLISVSQAQFTSSTKVEQTKTSYFLKKKVLTVSFNYTMKTLRTSLVVKDQPDQIQDETVTKLTIDNSVTITQGNINDESQQYFITPTGKKAAESEISLILAQNGSLLSINGKSESILPTIIESVGTIAATAIRLIGIFNNPVKSGATLDERRNAGKTKKEEITTVIPMSYAINHTGTVSNYTFSASDVLKNITNPGRFRVDFTKVVAPVVTVSLAPLFTITPGQSLRVTPPLANNVVANGIVYRKPAPFIVSVTLQNNNNVANYTVSNQIIDLPQFGQIGTIPLEIKRSSYEVAVEFDESTGEFKKYTYKKKSNAKKSLQALNQALNSVKGSVDTLRSEARKRNEANETKNSPSTLLQKQIDELTLQERLIKLQMSVDSLTKKQSELLDTSDEAATTGSSSAKRPAQQVTKPRR